MSSRSNQTTSPGPAQRESDVKWYTLAPTGVTSQLQVDPAKGLSTVEAQKRLLERLSLQGWHKNYHPSTKKDLYEGTGASIQVGGTF